MRKHHRNITKKATLVGARQPASRRTKSDNAPSPLVPLAGLARSLGRAAARDAVKRTGGKDDDQLEEGGRGVGVDLPPPPLTVHEVADYLGTSADVVRSLIRKRKLKAIKVEGQWRVFRADLAEYIMTKMERE